MPWGNGQYLKWFFYRHMIPVENEVQYDSKDLITYGIQKVSDGLTILDLAALSRPLSYKFCVDPAVLGTREAAFPVCSLVQTL